MSSAQGYITTTSSFQEWEDQQQQDAYSFASSSPARSRGRTRQRSTASTSSGRPSSADSRRSYYRTGISLRQQFPHGPASDFTPATYNIGPRYASDLPKVNGIFHSEAQEDDFGPMIGRQERQPGYGVRSRSPLRQATSPMIRQTKSMDSSVYATPILQTSSFDQSTISKTSGSARSSRSRDTRSTLSTTARARMPPPKSPLEHEYDYLRESLIMFGDGIEQESVGTGMSQQELLQRQKSDDEMIRRKEKKYGSTRKQKNRIVNMPGSSVASSSRGSTEKQGWRGGRQRSKSPSRRWNLIPSITRSRSRSQSPARAKSRGVQSSSSSYVPPETQSDYLPYGGIEPLQLKPSVDLSDGEPTRHQVELRPLDPPSIAAAKSTEDEPLEEWVSDSIEPKGSKEYNDFDSMQRRPKSEDEVKVPLLKPILLEEAERPLRIDPFETAARYQHFSPYDDEFEARRLTKIDHHRKELLKAANSSFDDGDEEFKAEMDSQLRSRMMPHPRHHIPQPQEVDVRKAQYLNDSNFYTRDSSEIGTLRSIPAGDKLKQPRPLTSLESAGSLGRVRWAENFGTPPAKYNTAPGKEPSPTSAMDFDATMGRDTVDPTMLYTANSFPSTGTTARSVGKPKSILRKPKHTSSDDSCPSDESPAQDVEGDTFWGDSRPHGSGLDFVYGNGRSVSPVEAEGTVESGLLGGPEWTTQNVNFAKNIPKEFQQQFFDDHGGNQSDADVFLKTVAAVVVQAAVRRLLAQIRVAEMRPRNSQNLYSRKSMHGTYINQQKKSIQAAPRRSTRRLKLSDVRSNPRTAHRLYDVAAAIIQSNFRGWWVRDSLTVDNYCAVLIQKTFRGYKCRMDYVYSLWQITTVQAVARSYIAQELATTRLYCILIIQSIYRGYRTRKQLKQQSAVLSTTKGSIIDQRRKALARATGGDFSPSRASKLASIRTASKKSHTRFAPSSMTQHQENMTEGVNGEQQIRKRALATAMARHEIARRKLMVEAEGKAVERKEQEQKRRDKIGKTAQEARDRLKRMMADDDVHSVSSASSRNRFQRAPPSQTSPSKSIGSSEGNKETLPPKPHGVTAKAARAVAFKIAMEHRTKNYPTEFSAGTTNSSLQERKTDIAEPVTDNIVDDQPPKRTSVLAFARQFEAATVPKTSQKPMRKAEEKADKNSIDSEESPHEKPEPTKTEMSASPQEKHLEAPPSVDFKRDEKYTATPKAASFRLGSSVDKGVEDPSLRSESLVQTPEKRKASDAATNVNPDDGAATATLRLDRLACSSFDEQPKKAEINHLNAGISEEEQKRLDKMHQAFQNAGLMKRPGESSPCRPVLALSKSEDSVVVDESHAEAAGDLIRSWRQKDKAQQANGEL